MATTLNSYALLLLRMGEAERVIAALEEFIRVLQRIYDGPHASLAAAYHNLASAFGDAGRTAEAATYYLRSIEVADRILRPNRPDRARPLVALADLYSASDRFADAETLLLKAHRLLESVGPEHRQARAVREDLFALYEARGRPGEARRYADPPAPGS